ncbi:hypothetical protein GGQ26_10510 [Aeromicrobium sp. zg-629]|nr:hypothetical protein [Aeromicrobium senzhongii]
MPTPTFSVQRARSTAAVLLATVLCVLALPATSAQAVEAGTKVTTGTITWGVKSSFRDYVTSPVADGAVEVAPPAQKDGNAFVFPAASGTWADVGVDVGTQGSVRFRGHDGALDITISKPRLVGTGSAAQLRVDAKDSDGTTHAGLAIADVVLEGNLTHEGPTVTVSNAPATLTAGGEKLFSRDGEPLYEAGTALDAVSAKLTLETKADPEAPTDPAEPGETTAPPADAGLAKVTGGTLSWGLKESFRSYLKMSFVEATTRVIAPATDDGAQTTFRRATGTWDSTQVDVRTRGGIHVTGHHGVMDFTVENLRLVVDAKRSHLRADVRDSEDNVLPGLVFATVDLGKKVKVAGDTVTITGAPVTLTKAGETMFDYTGSPMYTAGTALAPLNGTLTVKGATAPPKTTPAKPAAKPGRDKAGRSAGATKRAGRSGELTWGVKSSFRSYITGPIARGAVSVSGGATAVSGGYRFGQSSTSAQAPDATGTTNYRGSVAFRGHHGTLDFAVSQPSVRVNSPSSAVLSASVTGRGRIDIATLDLRAGARSTESGWVQYAGVPARLTAEGARVFSYQNRAFYVAGSLVDPVTFSVGSTAVARRGGGVVAASTSAQKWTAPPTPPATAGLTVEQDEIRAGDKITASGTGFLANETGIRVVLYSTPVVLAENVTADATGRATWTGTIPATVEPGKHTLTFQGSVDRGVVIDVAAAEEIVGCRLTDGRLDWGFKESFRAYVSGSIANGDWTTRDGARYETPEFTWSKGAGVLDEKTRAGELGFGGAIEFTGHDGALDTVIENPVVRFADEKAAVLTVDYSGGTMDAAMAGEDDSRTLTGVPFADLDLAAGEHSRQGGRVTISDVPATLTSAGSAAFPNYEAGTALDPVTLTYTVSKDCGAAAAPASDEEQQAVVLEPDEFDTASGTSLPQWVPWVGGALLGALAAIGATVLIMRRREVKA